MFNSRYLTSLFLVSVSVAIAAGNVTIYTVEDIINSRCSPSEDCYPNLDEIAELENNMIGSIVRKTDSTYTRDNLMYNTNQQRYPHLIAMVKSKEDIQKAILFAREFNLHVTIKSTGHDYCGRSTWANSFTIHLGNMKSIDVNPSQTARSQYGELKTETGTNWATIYKLLDSYNRTIVGGSAHTVGPGGYTLGGGHSPISRSHGYAVDNVLEMQVVLADGSIATCTESETVIAYPNGTNATRADGDLLWALRGGGGGTFGVTVYIVYKLHPEPSQMVTFSGSFPLIYEFGVPWGDIQDEVMTALKNFILNSPSHWGGYWILQNQPFNFLHIKMRGSLFLSLNKLAPWDNNEENELAEFLALKDKYGLLDVTLTNKSSFWDYEKDVYDPPSSNVYLMASFLGRQQAETSLIDFVKKELFENFRNKYLGCTGILVGGKTTEPSDTYVPLSPGYRSAVSVMSFGVEYSPENIREAKEFAYRVRQMGQGMYLNEPSIDSRYWREDFWGMTNYERLLQIKQRYDPENFFTCYRCVNSEFSTNVSSTAAATTTTTTATTAATPTNQTETSGSAQANAQWFLLIVTILCAYAC